MPQRRKIEPVSIKLGSPIYIIFKKSFTFFNINKPCKREIQPVSTIFVILTKLIEEKLSQYQLNSDHHIFV